MESDEWVTRVIELTVGERHLAVKLNLSTEPVKPQRVLPIFQQMTNTFVGMSVQDVEARGEKISCKMGCGACCRQPVPISEIEVYQIAELVEAMPEPRRSEIKKRFADACRRFSQIHWFERISACDELGKTESLEVVAKELRDAVQEYFRQGVPCPFLENESCSIHESRPLVCREYLVTSPAVNCSRLTGEPINRIEPVISPSKTVQHLGRTGRMAGLGFLPLIRALELAEIFPEAFVEKKSEEWIAEFFDRLTKDQKPQNRSIPKPRKQKTRRSKSRKS